jgi:hypothetical protein
VADLNLDPALAGALADIANGSAIKSIKIEGVTAAGQAVYDLTLATGAAVRTGRERPRAKGPQAH